ncbi:uncharacterized protein [Littorina saxatilis]|uniref:uncharacterized protein n=1 Tax=Littorina saxatilis TaxID=31220 RepID=UPI0038B48ED7
MKFYLTVFYFAIYFFVHLQGEPQCSCSNGCGNNGTTFPGSDGKIENVAYGKSASISSIYLGEGVAGPACVAVNGRMDTVFKTQIDPETNCAHTAVGDYNGWWQVDLGRNYTVTNITIYRRNESFGATRMSGMSVNVDGQLCYSFPNSTLANTAALTALPEQINIKCHTPITGRRVRFEKHGDGYWGLDYLINLCEVQVWACKDGLYGEQCDQTCSGHCKDNDICDNYYGTCLTDCSTGYRGDDCRCGHCKDDADCDVTTMTCPSGCDKGWGTVFCNQSCPAGTHGYDCGERCGQCADSDTCNTVTGLCPNGCQPGWKGDNCKQVCEKNMHGTECDKPCSAQCGGDGSCHRNNGTCQAGCASGFLLGSGFCEEKCQNGAFGPGCVKKCGNCAESRCNHRNGTCEVGCIDGHVGDMCFETSESSLNRVGPVAGAVFGGLCAIALSILVGLLIRRSRKRSPSETASPRQASNDQRLESGPSLELSGQAGLQEETGSAGVTEAEESYIYDEIQTPDDSDRAVYLTPVFKGQQANAKNIHTYQNYFA